MVKTEYVAAVIVQSLIAAGVTEVHFSVNYALDRDRITVDNKVAGSTAIQVDCVGRAVHVYVGSSTPFELEVPINVNGPPPHLPWEEDLAAIIQGVAFGRVSLGTLPNGAVVRVDISDRLSVNSTFQPGDMEFIKPTPWL